MDFATARRRMIDNQITPNRIDDPVLLEAMGSVPRELFVPKALQGVAYVDDDLAIGDGRFLVEPLVLAKLIHAAEIGPTDVVLDIGCASGYSAAVLGRKAAAVVALECDTSLVAAANATLQKLGIDNVAVMEGALEEGAPKQAPFDAIIICGAASEVPRGLAGQLADGGRLACVLRRDQMSPGKGVVFRRLGDTVSRREVFDASPPFLPGFLRRPDFVF
jgi:protein-L-isoaspartate(D-aspartate) O-methyltransferase